MDLMDKKLGLLMSMRGINISFGARIGRPAALLGVYVYSFEKITIFAEMVYFVYFTGQTRF